MAVFSLMRDVKDQWCVLLTEFLNYIHLEIAVYPEQLVAQDFPCNYVTWAVLPSEHVFRRH